MEEDKSKTNRSGPTDSDYADILFALGMCRGILETLPSQLKESFAKQLREIDKIVERLVYLKEGGDTEQ